MFRKDDVVVISTGDWGAGPAGEHQVLQLNGAMGTIVHPSSGASPKARCYRVRLDNDVDWPVREIVLSEGSMTLAQRTYQPSEIKVGHLAFVTNPFDTDRLPNDSQNFEFDGKTYNLMDMYGQLVFFTKPPRKQGEHTYVQAELVDDRSWFIDGFLLRMDQFLLWEDVPKEIQNIYRRAPLDLYTRAIEDHEGVEGPEEEVEVRQVVHVANSGGASGAFIAPGGYMAPMSKSKPAKQKLRKKDLKEIVKSLFEQDLIAFDSFEGRYYIGRDELLLSNEGLDALDLIRNKFVPTVGVEDDDS